MEPIHKNFLYRFARELYYSNDPELLLKEKRQMYCYVTQELIDAIDYCQSKELDTLNVLIFDEQYIQKIIKQAESWDLIREIVIRAAYPKKESAKVEQRNLSKPILDCPTFEEMFIKPEYIQPCIDVLKTLEPPLLNQNNQFVGTPKGTLCLWIDEMNSKGFIQNLSNDFYAKIVSEKFTNIDVSMFRKIPTRAKEKYQREIKEKLSQISL